MPDALKLYDLTPSPNTMKARIALRLKGLPRETIPVPPQDRSTVVQILGQPFPSGSARNENALASGCAACSSTMPQSLPWSSETPTRHPSRGSGARAIGSPVTQRSFRA